MFVIVDTSDSPA
jgi:hypothetical protein